MPRLIDQLRTGDFRCNDRSSRDLDRTQEILARSSILKSRTLGRGLTPLERAEARGLLVDIREAMADIQRRRDSLVPLIRNAVPVLADDVAAYVYSQVEPVAFREWDFARDFPILSPPFPKCFIEWHRPEAVVDARADLEKLADIVLPRAGVLLLGGSIAQAAECPLPELVQRRDDYAHWIALAVFATLDGRPIEMGQWGGLLVDGLGAVVGTPIIPDPLFKSIAAVALLAVTFMHCKGGVRVVEVVPPARLNAARRRRGREELVKHRTIVIEGLRELLRTVLIGDREPGGLKRALHLVRGHFACYDDKPLFGHYRGTVFRPAHTRGRKKEGKVIKDYEVKSPWQNKDG